jgi:hypothetical protein
LKTGRKEEKESQAQSFTRRRTWYANWIRMLRQCLHHTDELSQQDATQVNLDSLFACAWSPFKVTFDGVLHHYGTIVYTLGKEDGKWKIEGLTQNYRRTPGWDADEQSDLM